MHTYFVYILCSERNGTLYIGVTNNIKRRIDEHKRGDGSCFTSKYNVNKLVYAEEYQYVYDAIEREKQLKHSTRIAKIHLIEQSNPAWQDLYYKLF
ncbi:MAG: GIY-YIG nuclease family protein [Candidatus Dependentiae bacterium]